MNEAKAHDLRAALEQAGTAVSAAATNIASMPEGAERSRHLRALATMLVGSPEEFRVQAIRQCPDLESAVPTPNTQLDAAELEIVSRLAEADLAFIDKTLLASATSSWQKVARLIGTALVTLNSRLPGIPLGFYAQRVAALAQAGMLLARGDLGFIRLGEVRVPAVDNSSPTCETSLSNGLRNRQDQHAELRGALGNTAQHVPVGVFLRHAA